MTHRIEDLSEPRPLRSGDVRVLELLLSEEFPGHTDLLAQIPSLQLVAICSDCPSAEFTLAAPARLADTHERVPVEARGLDEDGVPIHLLVHVKDGAVSGIEVFREDGAVVREMPPLASLVVESSGPPH